MRRFLAARVDRVAACVLLELVLVFMLVPRAGAQSWNDPRSRALVEGATQRRAEQLADTALRDYQAVAHGYVAFLAQLGEGFRTPPKVIKTDELEDEIYWKAPNLSKQRIVGRRDTLLLPTDIAYHTDHLGIVQNNFADIIRIGDGGDEVADVPHPLSRAGLLLYDFALADSFSIGSASQRIHVYEVKVRPKDDRQPRVVGAVYIDQASSQVVRLNITFTQSAFLDKALEDLSLVLENRLVAGRFWLPSRQEIEIRRKAEWLDYPARGIIRGRWEIGDYRINQELSPVTFIGPEITIASPQVLAQHKWQGRILDSLPEDLRAISEPDIQRVQEEARAIVRAQALATAKRATLAGRRIDDFARFNRVEGLAIGSGLQKQLGLGWTAAARARYGIDDKFVKGGVDFAHLYSDGSSVRIFATRDFRDVGDVQERSGVVNSLAAQEFGSDYTDPYLVRALGALYEQPVGNVEVRLSGSYELESPLAVHARPVSGSFEPTIQFDAHRASLFELEITRPTSPWANGTELAMRLDARVREPLGQSNPQSQADARSIRGFVSADLQKTFGATMLVASGTLAGVHGADVSSSTVVPIELVFLGGPISAPGFDYHSFGGNFGGTAHLEMRVPAPFPGFSLGRYGRVPSVGTFAPYAHIAAINQPNLLCIPVGGSGTPPPCPGPRHAFPALGAAYILPFDLARIDVAKGFGRRGPYSPPGRWTLYLDVSREFWSIL